MTYGSSSLHCSTREGNISDAYTLSKHGQASSSRSESSFKRLEAVYVLSEGLTYSRCSDLAVRATSHRQVRYLYRKHSKESCD